MNINFFSSEMMKKYQWLDLELFLLLDKKANTKKTKYLLFVSWSSSIASNKTNVAKTLLVRIEGTGSGW